MDLAEEILIWQLGGLEAWAFICGSCCPTAPCCSWTKSTAYSGGRRVAPARGSAAVLANKPRRVCVFVLCAYVGHERQESCGHGGPTCHVASRRVPVCWIKLEPAGVLRWARSELVRGEACVLLIR